MSASARRISACSRRRPGSSTAPWPVKSSAATGPGHASSPRRHRRPATPRRARGAAAAAGPSPVAQVVQREARPGCASACVDGRRRHVIVGRPRSVEHQVGDPRRAARCARSGRRRRGSRTRPPAGRNGRTWSGSVPQPISSGCAAEHAEERHRQAGQPEHRPLRPPRAEPAEAHRRVDLPPPAVRRPRARRPTTR